MFDHNVLKKAHVIFLLKKKQRLMLKQQYSRDGFILAEEIIPSVSCRNRSILIDQNELSSGIVVCETFDEQII